MRNRLLPLVAAVLFAAPVFGKTTHTYYTDAEIAAIRQRAKQPDYADTLAAIKKTADVVASRPDDELWTMVPEADQLRAINVHFSSDCPVHGSAVHQKAGHYPWIMSPDKPFKLECPIGHEVYPSNDFAAYLANGKKEKLDTKQKYVDDGNGWVDDKGEHYYFVGHYMFWKHWRHTILDGATACGQYYLATGDARYAHKAAVLLARITQVYPAMNYNTQAYHYGRFPSNVNGRILDYIWENSTVQNFATTYDAVFDTLDGDRALKTLATKNGVPDVQSAIEQNLLQVAVKDIFEKKIWGNKFELGSLSTIALVLQNDDPSKGATTKQMTDWILTGPGDLEYTFWNGFDRDGIGGESSLGYSSIWNNTSTTAADNLARLGQNIVNHPKWLRLAKGPSQMRILDTMAPHIGDHAGTIFGSSRLVHPNLLKFAVRYFQDPYAAKLLLRKSDDVVDLFERNPVDANQLKKLAANDTFPAAPYTRDAGGYGLAILELNDGAHTRSAYFYYGAPGSGHGHLDRLNLGYSMTKPATRPTSRPAEAVAGDKISPTERDVLSDLGYPSSWTDSSTYWTKSTPSHYCVLVDEQPQTSLNSGYLTMFANLDGLKLAEGQGKNVWMPLIGNDRAGNPLEVTTRPTTAPVAKNKPAPTVSDYRRLTALLDTGEKSSLLIDAFVVDGGHQHDYSFHGLPFGTFSIDGAKLVKKQDKGTLAGEDIEYGVRPPAPKLRSGYQFLKTPAFYEPGDVTHLAWQNDSGLDMHAYFPTTAAKQVIVSDGTPPLSPGYPASMPYVFFRNRAESAGGQALQSLFLSAITCDATGKSPVASVERIAAPSPKAGGMLIHLKSGSAWAVYVNTSDADVAFADGTRSSVRFAAVQLKDNKPPKTQLVGAGTFTSNATGTLTVPTAPTARIAHVDYAAGTATAELPSPITVGKNGTPLTLASLDNHASYTVRTITPAADARSTLSFGETPLLTGRFAAAYDPQSNTIKAQERTGGVYNQFNAKSFVGMYAVSDDLKTAALIKAYDGDANTFTLDATPEQLQQFRDQDGDGRSYVYIADIAPGTVLTPTPSITVPAGTPAQQ
jgi:hypothetical protein